MLNCLIVYLKRVIVDFDCNELNFSSIIQLNTLSQLTFLMTNVQTEFINKSSIVLSKDFNNFQFFLSLAPHSSFKSRF